MLNYGSYYRNMEKALGKGVTLALGITHAESKILTKKTKKFNRVMDQLRNTPFGGLSITYAELRSCLVKHEMLRLAMPLTTHPVTARHISVPTFDLSCLYDNFSSLSDDTLLQSFDPDSNWSPTFQGFQ